jgi:phage-related protein
VARGVAGSIIVLWIDVIKSTRAGVRAIIGHVLAMLLFIGMLIEFILVKAAGTSTFFLLLIIGLVDVLAGFIVSIRSSQRQLEIEGPAKDLRL